MGSSGHDHHRRLLREVVQLRRELLGIRAITLPDGNGDIPTAQHRAYEAMLALPDGFLTTVRDPAGPFAAQDTWQVMEHIDWLGALPDETIPVCTRCSAPAALVIRSLDVPLRIVDAPDKFCLCRSESCDDDDLLLRIAIEAAGRPRILILGGNPYIDRAARRMDHPKVHVARDHFRVDPKIVGRLDAIIQAGGLYGHKHSAPIENAYAALPAHDRPLRLVSRPNPAAVASTILENRHVLRQRAVHPPQS